MLSSVQRRLLQEAMNRRDFLKFLGKAGAVAYGAPLGELGKLDPKKLMANLSSKNLFDVHLYPSTSGELGYNPIPFSTLIKSMSSIQKLMSKLVPGLIKMPKDVSQGPYVNLNSFIEQDDLEGLLAKIKNLGGNIIKRGDHYNFYFPDGSNGGIRNLSKISAHFPKNAINDFINKDVVPDDLIKQVWEYYPPKDTVKHKLIKIDPEGMEMLKSRGYSEEDIKQEFEISKKEHQDRQEHFKNKRQDSLRTIPLSKNVKYQFPDDDQPMTKQWDQKMIKSPFESPFESFDRLSSPQRRKQTLVCS